MVTGVGQIASCVSEPTRVREGQFFRVLFSLEQIEAKASGRLERRRRLRSSGEW
jgi:hypothetical protein